MFGKHQQPRLTILYRDGLWHVVREDAKTHTLFSTVSARVAAEWRDTYVAAFQRAA